MNRAGKIILLIIALTGYMTANSQNFDSMPQAQRDSLLISTATEAVLRYAPEYYREYKKPIIERRQVTMNPTGRDAGRIFYRIIFLYDTIIERLEGDFAVAVGINEDTGKPAGIQFADQYGRFISEDEWDSDAVIEQKPYRTMTFPIRDLEHPEKKEPKNIDELRRKGYEEIDGQWVQTKKEVPPNIDLLKRKGYEEINGQWVKTKKLK